MRQMATSDGRMRGSRDDGEVVAELADLLQVVAQLIISARFRGIEVLCVKAKSNVDCHHTPLHYGGSRIRARLHRIQER